jgi:hypothetical protein
MAGRRGSSWGSFVAMVLLAWSTACAPVNQQVLLPEAVSRHEYLEETWATVNGSAVEPPMLLAGCTSTYDCCIERHPTDPEFCGGGNTAPVLCREMMVVCLENKLQPEWNREKFGKLKDCTTCLERCKKSGVWPFEMCPG